MPPHLTGPDGRRHQRTRYERREPRDEARLPRAEPRHHLACIAKLGGAPRGPFPLAAETVRLLEQRGEPERVEVDAPIDDAERGEETADPGLRGEHQLGAGPAPSGRAERRDREQDVTQRTRMDDEGQRRSSASAASWRRPFVASAVPV